MAKDDFTERAKPGGGTADSAAGGRAESLHWILEKARSPEVQDRIREYVRQRHDATDPVWRDLIQDAHVSLYGGPEGSITLLSRGANPALDKDDSALGDEAFRVLTSAGEVEVVVSFAQDILSSPASTKALEQRSLNCGEAHSDQPHQHHDEQHARAQARHASLANPATGVMTDGSCISSDRSRVGPRHRAQSIGAGQRTSSAARLP